MKPADMLANSPKIKHGQKIDAPGIYEVPMAFYHEDCCQGMSVSAGGLGIILDRTPRAYWWQSPYNPDRDKEDATTAPMRIGSAAHTLVTEPHLFRQLYVTRPDTWDSWRTKGAREWRAEKQAEGFTVLDVVEYGQVVGIAKALADHPLIAEGLLAGYVEKSLFWRDEETGVWLKSRPDVIPASSNIAANLKTTNDVRPHRLRFHAFDAGWHVSMGLADMGIEALLGRKMEEHVVVAVEQKPPHDIFITAIDPDTIEWGKRLARKAIRIFAECAASGRWPSYEKRDTEYIRLPDWQVKLYQTDPELA